LNLLLVFKIHLQFVIVSILYDFKEDSISVLVFQVVYVGESVLDIAPVNETIPKSPDGMGLHALQRLAVFGAKLLEHAWDLGSSMIGVCEGGRKGI